MSPAEYERAWTSFVERVSALPFVAERSYSFDARPPAQAFVKGVFVFTDGARLHFREFADISAGEVAKLSYSYHAHDARNRLIFRYDNANHKPPLGFVEHKHLSDGAIIAASAPPVEEVFAELIQANNYFSSP